MRYTRAKQGYPMGMTPDEEMDAWRSKVGKPLSARDRALKCPDCNEPLYIVCGVVVNPYAKSGFSGPTVLECNCRSYPLSLLQDCPEKNPAPGKHVPAKRGRKKQR